MDYCQLFSRVTFHLGSVEDRHSVLSRPTDERVKQVRSGHPDLSLIALYYQFGRYLLISSSRPGYKALPANLQGIWNEQMGPAWGSKFTINVNTEMNYWLAETTNLSECHEPFLEFIKRLQKNGEITARKMYGCGGWVAHHNSDIWADTAPQDRVLDSTLWPMGAAWASTHIMEHFAFTGDIVFLDQAYGTLRGSVEFFLEFLIEKDGYLVTSPSLSPENRYQLPSGESAAISVGPTMDRQILFHLFTDFLNAANELHKENEDREIIATVTKFREKLPPLRIGRYGQLQEWREDYEEVEPGHRHVSHLWGLFPGEQITLKSTTLIDACRKTLERRAQFGGGHTGWSRAWMIALWARLRDGEEAARHVQEILRTSTHDSLLDDHPPFQIDGNFGATAGIAEMLVQSHDGEVFLLPALPTSWPEGCLQGLRTRGGFELSLIWSSGHLVTGTLHSLLGGTCVLNAHQSVDVRSPDGHLVAELKGTDNSPVSFETEKGAQYLLGRH
jgi:alpha-L-fucosidase 2